MTCESQSLFKFVSIFGQVWLNSFAFGKPNVNKFKIHTNSVLFGEPNYLVKLAFSQKRIWEKWIRPRLRYSQFCYKSVRYNRVKLKTCGFLTKYSFSLSLSPRVFAIAECSYYPKVSFVVRYTAIFDGIYVQRVQNLPISRERG